MGFKIAPICKIINYLLNYSLFLKNWKILCGIWILLLVLLYQLYNTINYKRNVGEE